MKELWKDIEEYNGDYQISNYGRVYSNLSNKILRNSNHKGYERITLSGKNRFKIHQLVWNNFGDGEYDGYKLQIDHIDNNKSNNRIDNLQLLTTRENTTKSKISKNNSSKYPGVCFYKRDRNWQSQIKIGGKLHFLGRYENEIDAANAYKKALESIENN